jgi:uncharacterized protein YjiS (DUF1127 family)
MSSARPVMRSGQIVQAPGLPDLARALWRRMRPRRHTRMPQLATVSDHLLADVGLDGPGYEQPTWERYIHRH